MRQERQPCEPPAKHTAHKTHLDACRGGPPSPVFASLHQDNFMYMYDVVVVNMWGQKSV